MPVPPSHPSPRRAVLAALALVLVLAAPARAAEERVSAPGLTAVVQTDPWSLTFTDDAGATVLREHAGTRLGFTVAGVRFAATRATAVARDGDALTATVATTDPLGRTLAVRIAPDGDGHVRLSAVAPAGVTATGVGFDAAADEGFYGFGERSNAVDQRGKQVTNTVEDGPYPPQDNAFVASSNPPYGQGTRADSTYYPLPWLLSSRGYGVLIDNDSTSRFDLAATDAGAWTAEVDGRDVNLDVYAGPRPLDALRRFSADTGRQPAASAPWVFGPWFQTGQPNVIPLEEEAGIIKALRDADAPVSAVETQMHFLPCGAQQGLDDYIAQRSAQAHAAGLAHLGYFNPSLCQSYQPVYDQAKAQGLLQRGPGGTEYTYPAFVGGDGPLGFTQEPLAQFDFSNPATEPFYAELVRKAFDQGYDGWMEDFGEYTPPFAESFDGTPGPAMHNRYPTDYHCTVDRIARALPRPVTRHQRSGWIGSAKCADVVWGGDPSTIWGFDGLSSTIAQGVGMGMSGVSRWGHDIGGYTSFGAGVQLPGAEEERLTPEMLERWIQMGAVSPVMRTKRSGIAVPDYDRPQVFDPEHLPTWRRYTKLHTQLYPYLVAADRQYRRTGLPMMRHALLTHPDDATARRRDGQFMFGDALLAAPVVAPGQRTQSVYAPAGEWLDFARAVRYVEGSGAFVPRRASVLPGRREYELAAPVDRLPLLVKAGSILPLLPAGTDTLAGYGGDAVTNLDDVRRRLTLLAFPRGRSVSRFGTAGVLRSREGRGRVWRLGIRSGERRTFTVRAGLWTLRRPFTPHVVRLGGKKLRRTAWRYDRAQRTLTVKVRARRGTLVVTGRR